jgi:hypothetical protein
VALIIEDGSGVANANSYATVAELSSFATARGLALPAGDAAREVLLIQACDFLEQFEPRYKGSKIDPSQELSWPRSDVFLFDSQEALPTNQIPTALKRAQMQLAFEASKTDLQPTGAGREVVREKLDVIEVQYAETKSGTVQPEFSKAMTFLSPLLKDSAGFALQSIRV